MVAPPLPPAPCQRHPRFSRESYPAIAERVKHESLRDLAVAYGVSHETIGAALARQHRRDLGALIGG